MTDLAKSTAKRVKALVDAEHEERHKADTKLIRELREALRRHMAPRAHKGDCAESSTEILCACWTPDHFALLARAEERLR